MSGPLLIPYRNILPRIHPTAFIAPGAVIIGDVEIGEGSSIWYGCVLRGDMNKIRIGARTNIQDGSVIHVSSDEQAGQSAGHFPVGGYATIIGDDVLVGHMALLHACVIESKAFIGMRATVMDGAKVESQCVLAAGALLPPGKTAAAGELWMGNPAKFCRKLTDADLAQFGSRSGQYARLAQEYK